MVPGSWILVPYEDTWQSSSQAILMYLSLVDVPENHLLENSSLTAQSKLASSLVQGLIPMQSSMKLLQGATHIQARRQSGLPVNIVARYLVHLNLRVLHILGYHNFVKDCDLFLASPNT